MNYVHELVTRLQANNYIGEISGGLLNDILDPIYKLPYEDDTSTPPPVTSEYDGYVVLDETLLTSNFNKVKSGVYSTAKTNQLSKAPLNYIETRSVMSNIDVAVTGDKHDYFSYGQYWWPRLKTENISGVWKFDVTKVNSSGAYNGYYPSSVNYSLSGNVQNSLAYIDNNPSKAENGYPYVNRAGNIKNSVLVSKVPVMGWVRDMMATVRRMGLAYYFSADSNGVRNEDYAKKVAVLIRTWFLNPATKMNPHMKYAQAVPGLYTGRSEGTIDFEYMYRMIDGVQLIKDSPNWTLSDKQGMQKWCADFTSWMVTVTPIGNIRIAYELTLLSCYLLANKHEEAYNRMEDIIFTPGGLLSEQIAQNGEVFKGRTLQLGTLKDEGTRPDSWGYSNKAVKLWFILAQLNDNIIPPTGRVKRDLFNYTDIGAGEHTGSNNLRQVFDFHYLYASGQQAWPYPTQSTRRNMFDPIVRIASDVWRDTASNAWWGGYLQPIHNEWLKAIINDYDLDDATEFLTIPYRYRDVGVQ